MTLLELSRRLARLERRVARLEAEERGTPADAAAAAGPTNMAGIRKRQAAGVTRRMDALRAVVIDLREERYEDPERLQEVIAERVRLKLGEPFSVRALYRKPYDTVWREPRDHVGADAIDADADAARARRLTRPHLIHRIQRLEALEERLGAARRVALLAESEGWEPFD